MDPRVAHEVSISELFDQFVEASTMRNVLSIFHRILNYSQLSPCEFNQFFPKLKQSVLSGCLKKNWKAKALFSKLDKRAAHRCYSNTRSPSSRASHGEDRNSFLETPINNNALEHYKCLVIGSGPAGLRTAIELQLLGASKVVVVEKRSRFSRNNVLHLWPFVIDDLKSLGAKKFYGKFCAGSIDHISIRQLQLILLKISLMLGCDFRDSCSYLHLCPSSLLSINNSQDTNEKENKSDIEKAHSFSDINQQKHQTNKCDLISEEEKSSCLDYTKVSASSSLQVDSGQTGLVSSMICDPQATDIHVVTEKLSSSLNKLEELKSGNAQLNLLQQQQQQAANDIKSLDNCRSLGAISPALSSDLQHQRVVTGPEKLRGIRVHFQSDHQFQEKELHGVEWDIIIGADGRRNTMGQFFPRKEFRGRLAIAITANFFNRQTPAEASVSEISGLSFIYNQDMFNSLTYDTNIQLENICYYKDDTHYFVMTAKKKSLLERGVLMNDYATTQDLLSDSNVDRQALLKYAKDAAHWTTGLDPLEFALNHYGQEDCAMFDFTSMHASLNACKAIRTSSGGLALLGLVGDSLLEPFWPTGSGCARGFLSSFDAAWMCRQWAINKCAVIDFHPTGSSRNCASRNRSPASFITSTKRSQPTTNNRLALSVLAERESIYRILAQTTSENLHQSYSHWTLNPHTRYPNLNRHHVVPSQIEHLLSDNSGKGHSLEVPSPKRSGPKLTMNGRGSERSRRIKSPHNVESGSRKSTKKLKSVTVSPSNHHHPNKHLKYKSSPKSTLSKSSVQKPIRMLYDRELTSNTFDTNESQYSNWELDYFDVSVSGTLPSSNNLQSLEARRARDIDECLRQRRQKSQLHAVKDQLLGRFKNGEGATLAGNAITQELCRLREQRSSMASNNRGTMMISGKENHHVRHRDVNNSLSLLNSIRRCASFAERVRSFEEKLSTSTHQQPSESTPVTPKIPSDRVQNLPNFATLQELFVGSTTTLNKPDSRPQESKKSKIPIMKLSKEDWNVKCWEDRLLKNSSSNNSCNNNHHLSGSMMSLNGATKMQQASRPEKQVELFKGRIKEMAEKLQIVENQTNGTLKNASNGLRTGREKVANERPIGGWVNHLKKELIKGVEARTYPELDRHNSTPLRKPVRKLFENEDEDGLDMSKHYDHLCINRPTNKYLSKGAYTSHLVRTKYNSATSRIIKFKQPETASKAAYLNSMPLVSRTSSASSTLSDYSSNTSAGSGGSQKKSSPKASICFRCQNRLKLDDRISVADVSFHSSCLTCSKCALTLRTFEVRHYVNKADSLAVHEKRDFLCSICEPSILVGDTNHGYNSRGLAGAQNVSRVSESKGTSNYTANGCKLIPQQASREEFLNKTINYNELYKNILANSFNSSSARLEKIECSTNSSSFSTNSNNKASDLKFDDTSRSTEDAAKVRDTLGSRTNSSAIPPLDLIGRRNTIESNDATCHRASDQLDYKASKSETVDGNEQLTLQLPGTLYSGSSFGGCDRTVEGATEPGRSCSSRGAMIDEEELEFMMKSCKGYAAKRDSSSAAECRANSAPEVDKEDTDDDDSLTISEPNDNPKEQSDVSEEASSLASAVDYSAASTSATEDDDDDNDHDDQQAAHNESTYDDFLTSEEFNAPSDDQGEDTGDAAPVTASSPDQLNKVTV